MSSSSNSFVSGTSSSKLRKTASKEEEIDVITRTPGAQKLNAKCGNMSCAARRGDIPLKHCARCKTIMYCSRECQVAHWKDHKTWCNNNVDHLAELEAADRDGLNVGLPDGMSLVELDQRLEKWVKYHNSLLMAATIHALELPRDLKRSHQYLLRVRVSYRTDNEGVPGKLFRVDKAFLVDIQSSRSKGPVWVQSIDEIERLRTESEEKRLGTVAAIALECSPLAMQIVPFGSLRDLSPLRIQKEWKEILIRNVENGKRFTRFE
ncbi:hypothetical protein CPB83DRAFT_851156 [Crepidotus variabilis]|uniref:MYND-type domain-containing protein n=1 Tax=Crepidotus variabilis TaxID=179855 RepID=A0A9P6EJU8_9AGAR|nr:hypothetical protein CPB83DRAFT_851156 [Crepidotus variabilis]